MVGVDISLRSWDGVSVQLIDTLTQVGQIRLGSAQNLQTNTHSAVGSANLPSKEGEYLSCRRGAAMLWTTHLDNLCVQPLGLRRERRGNSA